MKVQINQYTRSLEWHKRVHLSIKCGIPISTLSKNMNVDARTINKSYIDNFHLFDNDKRAVSLGRKSEPYFTESEMIQGFKVDVSELSKSELEIYNNIA